MKNNKIVKFEKYAVRNSVVANRQLCRQYHCAVAKDRMTGYCEVLIYDSYQKIIELFCLDFSLSGLDKHQYLCVEEALLWRQYNDVQQITYEQAMTLLNDAVQRGYQKDMRREDCVGVHYIVNLWERCVSSHVRRIVQNAYCIGQDANLNWLLQQINPIRFVEVYINAINNRDAALLYDMWVTDNRAESSRNIYAYTWSHALEELQLNSYKILYSKTLFDEQTWLFHLCILGERRDKRMLEVEMCIKLIKENGCLKVQEERVLDAVYAVIK